MEEIVNPRIGNLRVGNLVSCLDEQPNHCYNSRGEMKRMIE